MNEHDWYSFDIRRTAQDFTDKMIQQDNAVRHAREDQGRMMAEREQDMKRTKSAQEAVDSGLAKQLHLEARLAKIPRWVQRLYGVRT